MRDLKSNTMDLEYKVMKLNDKIEAGLVHDYEKQYKDLMAQNIKFKINTQMQSKQLMNMLNTAKKELNNKDIEIKFIKNEKDPDSDLKQLKENAAILFKLQKDL